MGNGEHQKVKQGGRRITPAACAIFAIGIFIGGTRSHKGGRRQGGELMYQRCLTGLVVTADQTLVIHAALHVCAHALEHWRTFAIPAETHLSSS